MDNFKKASREKLRFNTSKGVLSTEQLWDLPQTALANAIKDVKKILKKDDDDELSFLDDSKVVDKENQLRFDILKDVYQTNKNEAQALREQAETKQNNQKIMALIAEKEDEGLKNKTVDELKALLK